MPYTLYKTNGIKLTTVDDGTLNQTTDLQLVGKNYAGYGQAINQNLVKLLENFANTSSPKSPLVGQIWYDSSSEKLKYYTGTKWNQVSTTNIATTRPSSLANGEFWFDSANNRLYIKNNDTFILIGPGTGGGSSGSGSSSGTGGSVTTGQIISDTTIVYDVIKLQIGDATEAVISANEFTVSSSDTIISQFESIKTGITLQGADPITGVSSNNQSYFWGTAADAARFGGSLPTEYLKSADVNVVSGSITDLPLLTSFGSGNPPTTPCYITGAWLLTSGSTLQATYSDLAERYEADAVYEPGTVLVIGGAKEVTISTSKGSLRVAGIVSTDPAFKMNAEAGTDATHPYLALKGRVPCKVVGRVKKGDFLVTADEPGCACRMINDSDYGDSPFAIIGIALQDFDGPDIGVIEVKV